MKTFTTTVCTGMLLMVGSTQTFGATAPAPHTLGLYGGVRHAVVLSPIVAGEKPVDGKNSPALPSQTLNVAPVGPTTTPTLPPSPGSTLRTQMYVYGVHAQVDNLYRTNEFEVAVRSAAQTVEVANKLFNGTWRVVRVRTTKGVGQTRFAHSAANKVMVRALGSGKYATSSWQTVALPVPGLVSMPTARQDGRLWAGVTRAPGGTYYTLRTSQIASSSCTVAFS